MGRPAGWPLESVRLESRVCCLIDGGLTNEETRPTSLATLTSRSSVGACSLSVGPSTLWAATWASRISSRHSRNNPSSPKRGQQTLGMGCASPWPADFMEVYDRMGSRALGLEEQRIVKATKDFSTTVRRWRLASFCTAREDYGHCRGSSSYCCGFRCSCLIELACTYYSFY